jgi:acetyl esterase
VPLHPQAAAYLEQVAQLGAPEPWEADLAQLRRAYDEAAPGLFGPVAPVASVTDSDADGVAVRVYLPADADRGGPALVYLHGGGWVLGGRDSHDGVCRALATRAGCVVIAVDYRLAPERRFPAAIDDAWTATRWAAARHPVLAVAGDSAGGQLAAAVALRARDAELALALQVLIYPVCDYAFSTPSYREGLPAPALTEAAMRWYWSQYVPDVSRAPSPDCSPLRADVSGVAPAILITAEFDPLRDEGEAYARRLRAAGVAATLHRYDGLIHGFIRMTAVLNRADGAIDEVAEAVRRALAGDGG